ERSDLTVQFYYDHAGINDLRLSEARDTVDLDVQHHLRLGTDHEIITGGGYRFTRDDISNSALLVGAAPMISFQPLRKTFQLFNVFGQDTATLVDDRLFLTVGTKLEHNTYTGFEVQPNVRLLWTPTPTQSVWTAVSRAVRTPSRAEEGVSIVEAVAP